jgi:hypothetical protein
MPTSNFGSTMLQAVPSSVVPLSVSAGRGEVVRMVHHFPFGALVSGTKCMVFGPWMALALRMNCRKVPAPAPSATEVTTLKLKPKSTSETVLSLKSIRATWREPARRDASSALAGRPPKQGPSPLWRWTLPSSCRHMAPIPPHVCSASTLPAAPAAGVTLAASAATQYVPAVPGWNAYAPVRSVTSSARGLSSPSL